MARGASQGNENGVWISFDGFPRHSFPNRFTAEDSMDRGFVSQGRKTARHRFATMSFCDFYFLFGQEERSHSNRARGCILLTATQDTSDDPFSFTFSPRWVASPSNSESDRAFISDTGYREHHLLFNFVGHRAKRSCGSSPGAPFDDYGNARF